jgi:hypothetical protein
MEVFMTSNHSLELSSLIRTTLRSDLLQLLESVFPVDAVDSYVSKSGVVRRDRVFTPEATALTMIVTAFQEDRSLRSSVNIFQEVFRRNRKALSAKLKADAKHQATNSDKQSAVRSRKLQLPISKTKDVSLNTAAFSKARSRLEQGLLNRIFLAARGFKECGCVHSRHGREVFNTDGAYFQMRDGPGVPEKHRTQKTRTGVCKVVRRGCCKFLRGTEAARFMIAEQPAEAGRNWMFYPVRPPTASTTDLPCIVCCRKKASIL